MPDEAWLAKRWKMVETQVRARGVRDERVLQAMRSVPRDEFVDASEKPAAYSDNPLPIGYGQTISQPYIVAFMTELLRLEASDRVLEVGTGSGYQTAVLAEIASEVYTLEIVPELHTQAKRRLGELGYRNIFTRPGDGTKGWPEAAPFDKMILTAAGMKIPTLLVRQLKENGRIVMPVGEREQVLVVGEKRNNALITQESIPVRFVPLVEEGSQDSARGKTSQSL